MSNLNRRDLLKGIVASPLLGFMPSLGIAPKSPRSTQTFHVMEELQSSQSRFIPAVSINAFFGANRFRERDVFVTSYIFCGTNYIMASPEIAEILQLCDGFVPSNGHDDGVVSNVCKYLGVIKNQWYFGSFGSPYYNMTDWRLYQDRTLLFGSITMGVVSGAYEKFKKDVEKYILHTLGTPVDEQLDQAIIQSIEDCSEPDKFYCSYYRELIQRTYANYYKI
jgi:hypothetical protein